MRGIPGLILERDIQTNEEIYFRVDSTVFTSGYSTYDEIVAWNADSDIGTNRRENFYRPYRIKAGNGKRLFIIDTDIDVQGNLKKSPPTLEDVIGYFMAAKNKDEPVSTFVVYTQHNLKDADIPTAIYYPKPLHLQDAFSDLNYSTGDFPVAESISQRIFSLPMHPYLSDDNISKICDILISCKELVQ